MSGRGPSRVRALGVFGAPACASAERPPSPCGPPAFPVYAVTISSDVGAPRTYADAAATLAAFGYALADTSAAAGRLRTAPRQTASGLPVALTLRMRPAGDSAAIDLELRTSARGVAANAGEAALQRVAGEVVHEFGRWRGREAWLVGARCDAPAG